MLGIAVGFCLSHLHLFSASKIKISTILLTLLKKCLIEEHEAEGGSCRVDGGRSSIGSASTKEMQEGKGLIHQQGGD